MVIANLTKDDLVLLHKAIGYWEDRGFLFINLPWVVDSSFVKKTRPEHKPAVNTTQGEFVGSGEQSFIALHAQSKLPEARGYVGWTPCIREEPVFDSTHHLYFLKAEIYVPLRQDADASKELANVVLLQMQLFNELSKHSKAIIEQTKITSSQTDIELNGVEIGSYGLGENAGTTYIYGTVLALPRFRQALELKQGI